MRDFHLLAMALAVLLGGCAHGRVTQSDAQATPPQQFSLLTLPPTINMGLGISDQAAQADRLWEQRLQPEALATLTAAWQDQLASNPGNAHARGALMRAYLFAAEGPLASGDHQLTQQQTLQKALLLAEEAFSQTCPPLQLRLRASMPRLAELPTLCGATCTQWVLWYAVALTDFALSHDITVLLAWHAPLMTMWQDLIARGDSSGDAHAYLGTLYASAPAFAGGNQALAKQHLEYAMRSQHEVLRTRLWYVEHVLIPAHMRDAAAQLLRQVIDADAHTQPDKVPEQQLAQLRARQLLEHLDDLL